MPRTGSSRWQEIHLTPIEFSLLRVLATNRGLLMTHRALLTEVWGPEYVDAMPLLRTHIANLRAKLAAGGQGEELHPHRRRNRLPLRQLSAAPGSCPARRWNLDEILIPELAFFMRA